MKKTLLTLAVTGLMICACGSPKQKEVAKAELPSAVNQIQRGELLVATLGCNDCHSPKVMTPRGPVPDPDRLLSGHDSNEILPEYDPQAVGGYVLFNMNSTAAIGPWGTSFAGNLTPDATHILPLCPHLATWNILPKALGAIRAYYYPTLYISLLLWTSQIAPRTKTLYP